MATAMLLLHTAWAIQIPLLWVQFCFSSQVIYIYYHHHHHHYHPHSTSYTACSQYMRHCSNQNNRPPVQVGNWGIGRNSMACPYICNLHIFTVSCTPMVAVQALTLCKTCTGGLYLQSLSTDTVWYMWWSEGCCCWDWPTVTSTGDLFFFSLEQWCVY